MGKTSRLYSGSYMVSAADCSVNNTQQIEIRAGQASDCLTPDLLATNPLPGVFNFDTFGFGDVQYPPIITPTSYTVTGAGVPWEANANKNLTVEDTEDNAIARQNAGIGFDVIPGTFTFSTPRGAGQFSAAYRSVDVQFEMDGLVGGESYDITITFGRRVTGSGAAFSPYLTEIHSFVATGFPNETTPWIPLPVEDGFDTDVFQYLICRSPH